MRKWSLAILLALALLIGLGCLAGVGAAEEDFVIDTNGVLTKYNGPGGDVVIPNSVTSIGDRAFYNCDTLTSVTIPTSVTSIGDDAFISCISLTSVNISDLAAWCRIEFETEYSNPLIYAEHLYLNGTEVKDLTIPEGVTSIEDHAFESCTGLTSVTIPSSVTRIGWYAFEYCTSLTSVTIPSNVTRICQGAFKDCRGLTAVTIQEGVTCISQDMFKYCRSLTSVRIPLSVTSIGMEAFYGCGNLQDVYYGGGRSDWENIDWEYNDLYDIPPYAFISESARIHYLGETPASLRTPAVSTLMELEPSENAVEFDSGVRAGIYRENGTNPMIETGWDFSLFNSSAKEANCKLAISSLVLSANVYSGLIYDTLAAFGFPTDPGHCLSNFPEDWLNPNQVGVVITSTVETIGGKRTNVIAVVCRGSANGPDWLSNILLQDAGFYLAARGIRGYLDQHIAEQNIDMSLPTKLLITGHSRGAAVANNLGTMVSDIAPDDDVFVYTFACPNTTMDLNRGRYRNIHNFINSADPVPNLPRMLFGSNKFGVCVHYSGFERMPLFASAFSAVAGASSVIEAYWKAEPTAYTLTHMLGHTPAVYMACLLSDPLVDGFAVEYSEANKCKVIAVKCPVDVLIYDDSGVLLGTVTDNIPDEELIKYGVYVSVDGDEKTIYYAGELHLELVGTDDGEMEFDVQEIDMTTGEVLTEKSFTGVALTDGKTMVSTVAEDIAAADTQLFVQEDGEITAEIDAAGNETEVVILSFDVGLGDPVRDVAVPKGSPAGTLPVTQRPGYVFEGWYTDEGLTASFDASAALNASMTLYAKFAPRFEVYAYFKSVIYDGEILTTTVAYDYNNCDSILYVALYQEGKMIAVQAASAASGAKNATVTLPVSNLYGIYELRAFSLDAAGTWRPLCDCAEVSFIAN